MTLSELMEERLMACSLAARTKDDVIEELAELFLTAGIVDDKGAFIATIKRREAVESTAIGGGIAIPHGRSSSAKRLSVAFGRSKDGVEFEALDNDPVHLIFMIAAPESARKEYLQTVAKIARLLRSEVMRKALMSVETPKEVMNLIRDFDNLVVEEITVAMKEGRVVYRE